MLHELSHVALHLDDGADWFVDDLESESTSALERQADEMATEAPIPSDVWNRRGPESVEDVRGLARELGVSPTIVAGRARHEASDHRLFGRLFRDQVDRERLGWEP
jgi:HTH-type transcriptional regulator/antitoxin HigA